NFTVDFDTDIGGWPTLLPALSLPKGDFRRVGAGAPSFDFAQDERLAVAPPLSLPLLEREGGNSPEDSIHIGDGFSAGSAEVVVTQPRLPCYKLGVKFQMDDMVKRFLASRRTGFYFAVTREGEVGAGDELKPIARNQHDEENATPVSEITRLYI